MTEAGRAASFVGAARRFDTGPMQAIANAIIVLWGWRRFGVAMLAGAISALAMAPFDVFPVLFLTLPVFVWLIDGATPQEGAGFLRGLMPAAAVGWAFGFGYFLGGLWWIGAAFLVDADQFAWLMPLAVLILPAGLALFWGLGAMAARAVWPVGWPRILVFAVAMSCAEWLRGHVLTGFPWNALGYALTPTPLMMQSASLVGLWGLTLAAFIIFAAPAALTGNRRRGGAYVFVTSAAILFLAHLGYGAVRLGGATDAVVPDVRLRLVQPAINQSDKWLAEKSNETMQRYLTLSNGATSPERSGVGSATHLIWPESAFPFFLTQRPEALAAIADLLPRGTTLITGAARAEPFSPGDKSARVFNSTYVIGDGGEILSAYDKVDLVPFGEFLPLRSVFEATGMRQLIALPGGFSAGPRRQTLSLPNAPPFGPLICYEIIFPGEATAPGDRPQWLINLTNDAWFGDTPGPYQHLLQARVRAVEEGLPVVRAANSGISAIIDPYGRMPRTLGLGSSGIVDGDLPVALAAPFFARTGDWTFAGLLVLVILIAGLTTILKRN